VCVHRESAVWPRGGANPRAATSTMRHRRYRAGQVTGSRSRHAHAGESAASKSLPPPLTPPFSPFLTHRTRRCASRRPPGRWPGTGGAGLPSKVRGVGWSSERRGNTGRERKKNDLQAWPLLTLAASSLFGAPPHPTPHPNDVHPPGRRHELPGRPCPPARTCLVTSEGRGGRGSEAALATLKRGALTAFSPPFLLPCHRLAARPSAPAPMTPPSGRPPSSRGLKRCVVEQ